MKLNLTPDMILPCIYAFFASFGFSYVFNLRGKNMFYAALGGGLLFQRCAAVLPLDGGSLPLF